MNPGASAIAATPCGYKSRAIALEGKATWIEQKKVELSGCFWL